MGGEHLVESVDNGGKNEQAPTLGKQADKV
jgi:hypothetical protein